jgi:hypothetical protein
LAWGIPASRANAREAIGTDSRIWDAADVLALGDGAGGPHRRVEAFRNRYREVGSSEASCMCGAVVAGAGVECLSSTATRWQMVCFGCVVCCSLLQA